MLDSEAIVQHAEAGGQVAAQCIRSTYKVLMRVRVRSQFD
jgi:hypothetical protein